MASTEARKQAMKHPNPGTARKIKNKLGHGAYELYKKTGVVPSGLYDLTPPKIAPMVQEQADLRPDVVPQPEEGTAVTQPYLQSLGVGDIGRDHTGQRVRVQKVLPNGLRIHDPVNGARDLNWDDLAKLNLHPEPKAQDGKGPAARRIGELREYAKQIGIDREKLAKLTTVKEIEIAIGEKKAEGQDRLDQIDPMLASDDAKRLYDFNAEYPWRSDRMFREYWNNDNVVADEKLDGIRAKVHIGESGVRVDSRRRSRDTHSFSEKSQNFKHLLDLDLPGLEGTVLDSEGMVMAESGTLPSGIEFHGTLTVSSATANAGPQVAQQIQEKFGPMHFWFFDIIRMQGKDVSGLPQMERRKLLDQVLVKIIELKPEAAEFFHTTSLKTGEDKLKYYEEIIAKGGEGIILKDKRAKYSEGKRTKAWQKVKRFQEVDAYVTGFVPGKAGNEGYVGALELSVNIPGHGEHRVASVSQLTEEQRKAFTIRDVPKDDPAYGTLRPEVYGRVATFRGQEMTKNGKFKHAILVHFRDDKTKEEINGYEIEEDLRRLKVIK